METLYKSFAVEADGIGEDGGTVTGYASTFDREPDSFGDVVAPGAFRKSIERWEAREASIPLLYGHNTSDPDYNIGRVVEVAEDGRGLKFTAEFDPDSERAQYVRKLFKEGRIYQFSFAYSVLDQGPVELDGGVKANELRELEIYEISAVQIPANHNAEVVNVKDALPARDEARATVRDAPPQEADTFNLMPSAKAGRRNSKADADELRSVLGHLSAIESIVNGLLADELEEEGKGGGPEAKAEEPDAANAEEPWAPDAKALGLLQQASEILEKEDKR